MPTDYEKLFTPFKSPEPPEGLFEQIMRRVHKEERLLAVKRMIVFSLGLIGSAIAFFPALQTMRGVFAESGFMEFFSLLFSDAGLVMTYWQNFIMTLLESLPVISLSIFLAVIFVFLESFKFLAMDIKFIFTSRQLTK